jgi:glycosyltransferase involved in cell wall biosynthesis
MISIIIPALNEEQFLPHLLSSLVSQTSKDFEVIVVDGNSQDKTIALAETFKQKLPKLTVLRSGRGVSHQRNIGAAQAKGNFLLFVDADSILLPYAIERIIGYIQKTKPTIFSTWFCPDSDSTNDAMVTLLANMVIEGALLLHRPVAQGPLTGISKKAFMEVGGYDEALAWGEDYDLTKRVCAKCVELLILRDTLYVYSLRRMRHQGTLKLAQTYSKAVFSVLLMNKAPTYMPGYVMGGHPYNKKRKPLRQSVVRQFNAKIKALAKELLE